MILTITGTCRDRGFFVLWVALFCASRAAAVITTTPAMLALAMSMVTMSAAMRTLTMVAAPAPSIF